MRPRHPRPLHHGLTLLVAVVLAVGLALANAAVYLALARYLQERFDATLTDTPVVFVDSGFGDLPATDHDGDPFTGPRTSPFLQRIAVDGTVLNTQPGRDLDGRPFTADLSPVLSGAVDQVEADGQAFLDAGSREAGGPRLRVRVSADQEGRTLVVALPRDETDTTLSRLAWVQVCVSVGVLLLVCGAAAWLVRARLRPLRSLADAVETLRPDEFDARVPVDTTTREVHELATATDLLISRTHTALRGEQAGQERLRQFIADASHELRTPVAAVSAYAQLFELGAKDRPADLARSMAGIRRETARMRDLADDLLTLAGTDAGPPPDTEAVDVAAVIEQAVEAALAVDRHRPVTTSIAPDAGAVAAEPAGLRRVLDNLIGNVRTHTPAGTHTRVEARRQDGIVVLTVADNGPGLTEKERAHMFDRFWRKDPSRSRAAGGSGLGLSIATTLVESWHGEMSVMETPGGGLTVMFSLPAADLESTGDAGAGE